MTGFIDNSSTREKERRGGVGAEGGRRRRSLTAAACTEAPISDLPSDMSQLFSKTSITKENK